MAPCMFILHSFQKLCQKFYIHKYNELTLLDIFPDTSTPKSQPQSQI